MLSPLWPPTVWVSIQAEKTTTEILSRVLPCSFCHTMHQADKLSRPQWKHQPPLQLPAHPGTWSTSHRSQTSCSSLADRAPLQLLNCQSIHYGCGTTSSSLPKKLAQKHSSGPSHTPQPKPFLPNRWRFSFCPLLSLKPLITTVGQCVICMF